jgi:hypothetical protein
VLTVLTVLNVQLTTIHVMMLTVLTVLTWPWGDGTGVERRGNNLQYLKEFHQNINVKICPWLSCMCHIQSTAELAIAPPLCSLPQGVQGYLSHKKQPPPRTRQKD